MTSNTHTMTVTMTALIGLTLGLAAPAALAQPDDDTGVDWAKR